MKLPKFPEHKCALSLTHNDYLSCYRTVADELDDPGSWLSSGCRWVSDEQREKAIAENNVWTLQWYWETPIGLCCLAACDLDALLADWNQIDGVDYESFDQGYYKCAYDDGHLINASDFERGRQAGLDLVARMTPGAIERAQQTLADADRVRTDLEIQRESMRQQFVAFDEREKQAKKAMANTPRSFDANGPRSCG